MSLPFMFILLFLIVGVIIILSYVIKKKNIGANILILFAIEITLIGGVLILKNPVDDFFGAISYFLIGTGLILSIIGLIRANKI